MTKRLRLRVMGSVLSLCAALVALSSAACVKQGTAVENLAVSPNIASYWTCGITFASDGQGPDANEAFTFVPWLEGRVRERGVFEPLGRDEGHEAEVTLRVAAAQAAGAMSVVIEVIDTKTKQSLGEVGATAPIEENADAGENTESKRIMAIRAASDRILELLKEKRRLSVARTKQAPPVLASAPSAPLPDGPPVGPGAICTTECHAPAAATSTHDEQYRVASGMNATMKELRQCLDRVGAQQINPIVLLRFSPDGQLRHMRLDVGGFEQMQCVQTIKSRPPRSVSTTRASLLRCEYRCTLS